MREPESDSADTVVDSPRPGPEARSEGAAEAEAEAEGGLAQAIEHLRQADALSTDWQRDEVEARLFGLEPPERAIGRYVVTKRLGAGGMGEVFAGYDPTLDRPVAIKLLHADLEADTEHSRARMVREAKTLAKLSHPNVVQVYEVGESEARVFIAMELIAGVSVRSWVQRERPGWREVLRCYLAVGRGLVAVHRAGLVHRDVKPDNVLLGDDGRVCVADFGLARHASASAASSSWGPDATTLRSGSQSKSRSASSSSAPLPQLTRTGRIAGTPAYMAPEQLRGHEVDARADQFAFCVALYEGLYGQRPFVGRSLAALAESHGAGPMSPPRRSRVPRRLWRVLVKGLAVDPRDRFVDMEALLRVLDPARARRRRLAVAVAVAGPVLVVGVSWLGAPDPCPSPSAEALGWGDDPRARVRAGLGRAGVEYAATVEDTVVEALDRRVVQLAEAQREVCEATHVEHVQSEVLLDRRMLCLGRISDRLGGLVTALADADVDAIDRAAEAVEALPPPERCAAEHVAEGVEPPPAERAAAVAESRRALAQARGLHDLGEGRRAHEQLEGLEPDILALDYAPLQAELRYVQGLVAKLLGQPDRAAERYLEAVELAEGSRHDLLSAEIWSELTLLGYSEISAKEARAWLPRARAAVKRIGSPDDQVVTIELHEGKLALYAGDYTRAGALLTAVLERRRAGGRPLATARAAQALAEVYTLQGEHRRALSLHEDTRRILGAKLGDGHPWVANTEYNIGASLLALGRHGEAKAHLQAAIEGWAGRFGPDHLDLALAYIALQQIELDEGTIERATEHAREALRIRRLALPAGHGERAHAELVLGVALFHAGQLQAAASAFTAAWEGMQAAYGEDDVNAALARAALAEAQLGLGQGDQARGHVEAALRVLLSVVPEHPVTATPLRVRGVLALRAGDRSSALVDLRRAQALVLDATDPQAVLERGEVQLALSRALWAAGDADAALDAARDAEASFGRSRGEVGRRGVARAQRWQRGPEPVPPRP